MINLDKVTIPEKVKIHKYKKYQYNLQYSSLGKIDLFSIKALPIISKVSAHHGGSEVEISNCEFDVHIINDYIDARAAGYNYITVAIDYKYSLDVFADVILSAVLRCGVDSGGKIKDKFKFAHVRGRYLSILSLSSINDHLVLDILD